MESYTKYKTKRKIATFIDSENVNKLEVIPELLKYLDHEGFIPSPKKIIVSKITQPEEYTRLIKEYCLELVVSYKRIKKGKAKKTKEDEAIKKIIDKSKMDIPEAMISTQCETMVEEFAQRIAQSGLTMEQYLQFSGMTVDQLKEQVRPEALTRIQSSLVLEQIAKDENIEVTDADVDAEVEKMAKAYGMEPDKLKEYMGDAEKESMKKDIAITKAVDLIMDNIKERAKAKRKTDAAKEESTEE